MDGSVWWWSYGSGKKSQPKLQRAYWDIGKSGWAAGVNDIVIASRFFGVSYDAPHREFRFMPLAAMGTFSWQDFPLGYDRFSVSYEMGASGGHASFANHNEHPVILEATLPVPGLKAPAIATVDGQPVNDVKFVRYLGNDAVHFSFPIAAHKKVELQVTAAAR